MISIKLFNKIISSVKIILSWWLFKRIVNLKKGKKSLCSCAVYFVHIKINERKCHDWIEF